VNALFCVNVADGATAWTAPLSSGSSESEGGGRRRGGGRGGYGSIVDAGPVLFALTTAGDLVVFEPNKESFRKVADYKVAQQGTYAHPIIAGQQLIIKDQDAVTMWSWN
jgi:hypothetical protein